MPISSVAGVVGRRRGYFDGEDSAEPIREYGHLERDDDRPTVAKVGYRLLHRGQNTGLVSLEEMIAADTDAQPVDRLIESGGEIRHLDRHRPRIASVMSSNRIEHMGAVGDCQRQR